MMRLTASFKVSITLTATLVFGIVSASFSEGEPLAEVAETNKDIQTINLLNCLDLRKKQMESIIRKAEQAKALQECSDNEIRSLSSKLAEITQDIKSDVGEGKVVLEKELSKEYTRLEHEIKRIKKETYAQIDKIALDIESELESFQLNALDNYRPCVVPIVTDGRIGQSGSSTRDVKLLERVKNMPAIRYDIKKEQLIEDLLTRVKEKVPPAVELDESTIGRNISNIFDKVRAMEEIEFEIHKEALAEELRGGILPEKKPLPRKAKIRNFLLSNNIIPILKERLNASVAH